MLRRAPIDCPETGEPCTKGDCSVSRCVIAPTDQQLKRAAAQTELERLLRMPDLQGEHLERAALLLRAGARYKGDD